MKVISSNSEAATVQLTADELMILANGITQSRESLEDWEFHTIIGAHPPEALALRKALVDLLDSLGRA